MDVRDDMTALDGLAARVLEEITAASAESVLDVKRLRDMVALLGEVSAVKGGVNIVETTVRFVGDAEEAAR